MITLYKLVRTNLLYVRGHFLLNFLITSFVIWRLSGVHLIDANNKLLDAECKRQQSMLACLAVFADASLKLPSASSHDQYCAVRLYI